MHLKSMKKFPTDGVSDAYGTRLVLIKKLKAIPLIKVKRVIRSPPVLNAY